MWRLSVFAHKALFQEIRLIGAFAPVRPPDWLWRD